MRTSAPGLVLLLLAASCASGPPALSVPEPPVSVPESSGYTRTSTHADVLAFLDALETVGDGRLHRTTFGTSQDGRELPLVVWSDPPVRTPAEARALDLPVVLVLANIHAGEVEGKEACLQLLRELVWEQPPFPQGRLVLLVAPIYNADGNEVFGPRNRPLQQGPSQVGQRPNAQGLDLNRDFLKAEAPETRALLGLMNAWDPLLTVDLHTTDGSAHGYALTYAPPLTPSMDARLAALLEREWLPRLRARMRDRHGLETFDYGNFLSDGAGWYQDEPDLVKGWRTFDHRPRFGTNYVGLRNRAAILSEAYSYADFESRIAATHAFVIEILRMTAERGPELARLCATLDRETAELARAGLLEQSVAVELVDRGRKEQVRIGAFEERPDPQTGELQRIATGLASVVEVPCFVKFVATDTRVAPAAWLLPPEAQDVAALLAAHGVVVQRLDRPYDAEVTTWTLLESTTAEREFQGHFERGASWETGTARRTVPAGGWLVPGAQPLARVAFQLLSPESDDGCLTWNVYDPWLEPGQELPVYAVPAGRN